jgi:hypothetical protein
MGRSERRGQVVNINHGGKEWEEVPRDTVPKVEWVRDWDMFALSEDPHEGAWQSTGGRYLRVLTVTYYKSTETTEPER